MTIECAKCNGRCAEKTVLEAKGFISSDETVVRVVISPNHINKKTGSLKPSVFASGQLGATTSSGLSIIRLGILPGEVLERVVIEIVSYNEATSLHGVITANVGALRAIDTTNGDRALCVYPDPIERTEKYSENPAHSLMVCCDAPLAIEDPEIDRLKMLLLQAFSTPRNVREI